MNFIPSYIELLHNGELYKRAEKAYASLTSCTCLLYTSDAADERSSVDLGGRRIIKKKKLTKAHRRINHT